MAAGGKVVADGVLEAVFVLGVADVGAAPEGFGGWVAEAAAQEAVAELVDVVVLAGAGDDVKPRDDAEEILAAALAHAAHEAVDYPGFGVRAGAEEAHFALGFEFGFFADGAGVDEDDVGGVFIFGEFVASCQEHAGDLFGVAFVHLAAVGFDEDAGHGVVRVSGVRGDWMSDAGRGAGKAVLGRGWLMVEGSGGWLCGGGVP